MGANQNSSREFDLYPEINPMPLFHLGQDRLAIDKLSALRTKLGTTAETRLDANKNTCEIDNKSQTKIWFISSQIFHRTPCVRVQGITAGVHFRLINLESFDPVTQEVY
jgi:hypothetical protein